MVSKASLRVILPWSLLVVDFLPFGSFSAIGFIVLVHLLKISKNLIYSGKCDNKDSAIKR
jgi:hypothetical protein